jgi:transcription termination/antitermination protein NusA
MTIKIKAVLDHLSTEKGIDKKILVQAMQESLEFSGMKAFRYSAIDVKYDEAHDTLEITPFKLVVAHGCVFDSHKEIDLQEALLIDDQVEVGDEISMPPLTAGQYPRNFTKQFLQVFQKKIMDLHREQIIEFRDIAVGKIVSGTVVRMDKKDLVVDLGDNLLAVLPEKDQIIKEKYKIKDMITAVVLEIRSVKTNTYPVVLSRASAEFIRSLFFQEIAEIQEGVVKIKAIARDVGRSKVAVYSENPGVDPISICIGMRGMRIQNIIRELRNEKIDVVRFDEDYAQYVSNAITPATVTMAYVNEKNQNMQITVPDDQLSLAIGKKGQNIRLTSQLTKWKIEVKSETQWTEYLESCETKLQQDLQITPNEAAILVAKGYTRIRDIVDLSPDMLVKIVFENEDYAAKVLAKAQACVEGQVSHNPDTALEQWLLQEGLVNTEDGSVAQTEDGAGNEVGVSIEYTQFPMERILYWMSGISMVGLSAAAKIEHAQYETIEDLAEETPEILAKKTGLPIRYTQRIFQELKAENKPDTKDKKESTK